MRGLHYLLLAVLAVSAVIPGHGIAGVVLFDDFEDGTLDLTLWSTPWGGVQETDGVCQLTDRNYLNTVSEYNPHEVAVAVSCDFKWLVPDDSFVIVMRSDGRRGSSYDRVLNGFAFGLQSYDNGRILIDRVIDDQSTVLFDSEVPTLTQIGIWHNVKIVDDGLGLSCYLDEELVASALDDTEFEQNLVTFYNREYATMIMEIDNAQVELLGPTSIEGRSWGRIKGLFR